MSIKKVTSNKDIVMTKASSRMAICVSGSFGTGSVSVGYYIAGSVSETLEGVVAVGEGQVGARCCYRQSAGFNFLGV